MTEQEKTTKLLELLPDVERKAFLFLMRVIRQQQKEEKQE